jgi:guanylate kinase
MTGSGKLIVISAPSGSGKTTIAREIIKRNRSIRFSVSATTRPKRRGEVDGRDYYFLEKEDFRRKIQRDEFVEWEELFGNYYGTLKSELDKGLSQGQALLFDVDVKGGLSIKRAYPTTLMIFVKAPSVEVLRNRLIQRRTEDKQMLAKRIERVPMELELGKQYEYQVINDDLQRAVDEVQSIVHKFLNN